MATATAFTPSTFAKLSPHPFLLANLQRPDADATTPPSRANGRRPDEPRCLSVNTSSLSHAHGSAMVRVGDTSVICGVRGEILPATHIPQWRVPKGRVEREGMTADELREEGAREMQDYDLLVPNIELATGCAPQFLPGVPPSSLAQTLSTRVYSLLHNAGVLNTEDLRIWYDPPAPAAEQDTMGDEGDEAQVEEREVKAYWTLYIDVLFISFDGNPFDAAWAAILAALRDTKLPKAWWDADREMVLCSSKETKPLGTSGLPVACTAAVLTNREQDSGQGEPKSWVLVDPDREEEKLCDESVTVVVDRTGGETRIRGISKVGGRLLGSKEIREMVGVAERRWDVLSKELSQ
ncbi:ribosomal protein S5 domain 2-like protein [Cryphonectria parasitica EP155]|uniref:Ribosomal RNA-processing protein 43 n=1 Tax=Cryphonectria parasitica (strain ATCC 38755 / EP155) TaxID=660469 RepID=A0A9P4Y1U2_CRYP1|nr:ribosomal protein S5 domain 2-like protein [Cryphonectria parasitica EP155]KAF3765061.1 ribosomal protein S5 domain 2-like protein [Cryphonectria parasitica EP155]